MSNEKLAQLVSVVRIATSDTGREWLDQSAQALRASTSLIDDASRFSAMARRKLGDDPLPRGSGAIAIGKYSIPLDGWILGDVGRVALLLGAAKDQPDHGARLVDGVFRMGNEQERAAIIRGLALMPEPESLKAIALEASRTNKVGLYRALAMSNPYPALFFDDHAFNQVVLKSAFIDLPLDSIIGLRERANPELSRMCEDYVDECLEAERSIPSDIWLAVAPYASKRGKRQLLKHLEHEDSQHRYFAAHGLIKHGRDNSVIRMALVQRELVETNVDVSQALRTALKAVAPIATAADE